MDSFVKKPLFILGVVSLLLGLLFLISSLLFQQEFITLIGNLENKSIDKLELFLKKNQFEYTISDTGDSILVPASQVHVIREKMLASRNLINKHHILGRLTQPSFLKKNIKIKQEEAALEGLLLRDFNILKVKKFKKLKNNKDVYVFLFNDKSKDISHKDVSKIKEILKVVSKVDGHQVIFINTKGKLVYDSSKTGSLQTSTEIVTKLREAIELENILEEVIVTSKKSKRKHLVFVNIDKGVESKRFNLKSSIYVDGNSIHQKGLGFNKENIENYKGYILNEVMMKFFGNFELTIKETIFSEDSQKSINEISIKTLSSPVSSLINYFKWSFLFSVSLFLVLGLYTNLKIVLKKSDNWLFENLDRSSLKNMFKEEPEYLVAAGLQGLKRSDREQIKSIVGQELFNKVLVHVENVGEVSDKLKNKVKDYIYERYKIYSNYLKNPESIRLDELSSIYQYLDSDEKKAVDWYLKENSLSLQESFLPIKVSEFQRIKSELFKR